MGKIKTKRFKHYEAERISVLKEKLIGLELAYETNLVTVPVTQVPVDELAGVTMHPWDNFWDHEKIDLRTPVILGREKNVIAGPFQYFEAKDKGLKIIDAVYLDSLLWKSISIYTLKKQFQDKDIAVSFAYSLYALVFDLQECVSYKDFYKNANSIFIKEEVGARIESYILETDREIGG